MISQTNIRTLMGKQANKNKQNQLNNSKGIRVEVALLCLDMLAFAGIPLLALYIRFWGTVPTEHYLPYMAFLPVFITLRIVFAYLFDLYDFRHRLTPSEHIFSGIGVSCIVVLIGYFILAFMQIYYDPASHLSRLVPPIDLSLMIFWFAVSRTTVLWMLYRSGWRIRVALIGNTQQCDELSEEIATHAPKLIYLAGTINSDLLRQQNFKVELFDALLPLDHIILTDDTLQQDELNKLLRACDSVSRETYLFPEVKTAMLGSAALMNIAGLPLIPLRASRVYNHYLPIKAAFDRIASFLLLLVFLPVILCVSCVIYLSMGKPVLFIQERIGLQGNRFRLFKFRTMIPEAELETGPMLSPKADPRITPLGLFLRRYRLDELPQLWNILSGEMSFVGPRPERPEFVAQFVEETPLYERRHLVMPGLTGLAQIHGRYDSDYLYKLRYDLMYVNGQSLLLDLRVLVSTLRIIITGSGGR